MVSSAADWRAVSRGRALLLMVPANRPDRFPKAITAGADAVIIDLEDAVPTAEKDAARDALAKAVPALDPRGTPVLIRINGAATPGHEKDIAAIAGLPIAGIMLAKAEAPSDLMGLARIAGGRERVIALVESARGLSSIGALAESAGRIAFGAFDFAADVGAACTHEALLYARAELVLASRLAGLAGPIDGATASIDDGPEIEAEAAYAAALGFLGKLLIHPKQVTPAARGFRPSQDAIDWAQRIVATVPEDAVAVVDGCMVDRPVYLRAQQVLQRAGLLDFGARRDAE